MITHWLDRIFAESNVQSSRRTALQTLGVSTLAAGMSLAVAAEAQGKNGKHKKRKKDKKQGDTGATPAPGTLEACRAGVICLIDDPICTSNREQCCAQLAAGQTTDAVQCLIAAAIARC